MVSQSKRIKKHAITVYCSPEEHEALKRTAAYERQPISQWARNQLLLRHESLRPHMSRRAPLSDRPPAPAVKVS